jgi:hypothetical protein
MGCRLGFPMNVRTNMVTLNKRSSTPNQTLSHGLREIMVVLMAVLFTLLLVPALFVLGLFSVLESVLSTIGLAIAIVLVSTLYVLEAFL